MRRVIFFVLAIFLSINSFAGGWTAKVKIEGVYILNENTGIIKLSSFNDPEGCWKTKPGNDIDAGHVYFDPSEKKSWYSLILATYMAQKDVKIYVSGGCQEVWSGTGFAKMSHFRSY
ncbi:hypothetical protein [Saccharophagus degradans]|uniref:Uncharacterized protein n=1 Tax=Saccharophagus degradans (strain 2-40 / ATCC 43961 / DSM 17024) TaxID=203122 RepID=Q21NK7_SACD2|nr:hypothetical protein [Saccharophagus degradans]ABD79691.1 hypothetical protein Sde_0427 [Saccharophagus degradans 2-40]ABD79720.1 hypothetical protein Sde_0456 [Saccharophagus degradans 2-40]ABD79722.1 hypothetical protein Sde_0458 [Saccharophagus degradans 2-40]